MKLLWVLALLATGNTTPESVLNELHSLDRSLAAKEPELVLLEQRERAQLKEAFEIQAELSQRRLRAAEVQLKYQRRLRALHRMPSGARMVALGKSRSLKNYLSTTRMLRWVTEYDRKLLVEREELVRNVQTLEAKSEKKLEAARSLTSSVRSLRDALASEREGRLRWVHQIVTEPQWQERFALDPSVAAEKLRALFGKLRPHGELSSRFANNRSKLPWPVVAPVKLSFGALETTGARTRLTSRGLHLNAKAGTPVQSIAKGVVVYADWLSGYGKIIIIDHGTDYHSLYAHLSGFDVQLGAQVSAQQLIGTVGDTGSVRGTSLYFEIRQAGQPIDPASWLRK